MVVLGANRWSSYVPPFPPQLQTHWKKKEEMDNLQVILLKLVFTSQKEAS